MVWTTTTTRDPLFWGWIHQHRKTSKERSRTMEDQELHHLKITFGATRSSKINFWLISSELLLGKLNKNVRKKKSRKGSRVLLALGSQKESQLFSHSCECTWQKRFTCEVGEQGAGVGRIAEGCLLLKEKALQIAWWWNCSLWGGPFEWVRKRRGCSKDSQAKLLLSP